jgi:hypothetical protein
MGSKNTGIIFFGLVAIFIATCNGFALPSNAANAVPSSRAAAGDTATQQQKQGRNYTNLSKYSDEQRDVTLCPATQLIYNLKGALNPSF